MKSLLFVTSVTLFCGAVAAPALAASDPAFLKKALEGDNSEMALGQMAAQRGQSAGTRDYGRMLHDDHAKAKTKALVVARAHGVADTEEMAPEAKAEAAKLKGLSGRAFDQEFARYMVEDHTKDIADFRKQARQGDAATKALATNTLPDLEKHLKVAQTLAGR